MGFLNASSTVLSSAVSKQEDSKSYQEEQIEHRGAERGIGATGPASSEFSIEMLPPGRPSDEKTGDGTVTLYFLGC